MNNRENKGKRFILSIINIIGGILFFNIKRRREIPKIGSEVKKVLFIELWGIGDLILMTPALESFKKRFPYIQISLLSKPVARVLFNGHLINNFIEFEFPWTSFKSKYRFWKWNWKGLIRTAKKLRRERYDLVLDARGDFRNNLFSFLTGAKRRVGYDWSGGGYFLTDVVGLDYRNKHRVDAWINLLSYLGIKTENPGPRLHVSKEEEDWARDFLIMHGVKNGDLVIGVHPGCRIKTRSWPLENFARVAEYIRDTHNAKILVFIEPDGYGNGIPIKGEYIKAQINLRQLMVLNKKLALLICNDGGPMHIATAVDTPVVAIFGPTNPVWFGPYGINHTIIIKEDIKCRPCFDYCKFKERLCITNISVREVLQEVDKKIISLKR